MWHQVDWDVVAREENAWLPPHSPAEVEQAVVVARLHLYNRGLPCGAAAVQRYLHQQEGLRPLPSTRQIRTLLTLYGLTYGRTGWYAGEDLPEGIPASAWVAPEHRRYYDWATGIQPR
jgi:hypothetical protein